MHIMSSQTLSRRRILQGALVVAFNPVSRSWAASQELGTVSLPPLDGKLLTDEVTREKAADDFGHAIHLRPWAVLKPGSVEDIVKMIRFARSQRIKIAAARGLGESHSYFGQSQVEGGVVIDMSTLSTIHEITEESAWVDTGVRWKKLVQATILLDKSPPTLTDYLGLSIGGTLSVGGIGGQTFREGLQVDNVLELEVVTGTGELVRCSPSRSRELFDAVRGGLGQCGIIVRARIRLVKVPPNARMYVVRYEQLGPFMKDQRRLIQEGRFDYVEGSVESTEDGWRYELMTLKYFGRGAEPNDQKLLAGLSFTRIHEVKTLGYFEFANRLEKAWDAEELTRPHPWLDLFVPDKAAETFVEQVLRETSGLDVGMGVHGRGVILLYAINPARITAPFARIPKGETAFLFSLLRTATPSTPENVNALIAKNRSIFDKLTALGGKRYGASTIRMTPSDWREHFQPVWEDFQKAKRRFDPDNILTPGQHIF
jgi:cytokinin dehydrogenase